MDTYLDMIPGLRLMTLTDFEVGTVLIAHAVPVSGSLLGALQALPAMWHAHIPIVPETALQHALRGWAMPLMRTVGPHPHMLMKRVSSSYPTVCQIHKTCPIYNPKTCFLNSKQPDCYEYPYGVGSDSGDQQISTDQQNPDSTLITVLLQCWKEGRYVIGSTGEDT